MKLAVSGCPRNCAEATVKDIGVICVDSGYDIHSPAPPACMCAPPISSASVETEEEALEHVPRLMQLYREEAAVSRSGLQMGREVRPGARAASDHGGP